MNHSEFKAKFAEPQSPPGPAEIEITDYHRVVWIVRSYMRRVTYPPVSVPGTEKIPGPNESFVEFYEAPDGACWRMAALNLGGLILRKVT